MIDDSWKGEDRIRSVPRVSGSGMITRMRMGTHDRTKAKDQAKGRKPVKQFWAKPMAIPTVEREICSTEGCRVALRPDNASGRCRWHIHQPGCRCQRCRYPLPTKPRAE